MLMQLNISSSFITPHFTLSDYLIDEQFSRKGTRIYLTFLVYESRDTTMAYAFYSGPAYNIYYSNITTACIGPVA